MAVDYYIEVGSMAEEHNYRGVHQAVHALHVNPPPCGGQHVTDRRSEGCACGRGVSDSTNVYKICIITSQHR